MSLTVDGWSGSIWSVQPWTGMMNTASSVNSCHQSHGVAMADDSTPAPGPQVWRAQSGLALECRSIRQVQANVTYRNVKCMHYKADRVHHLVWVQRICRFFDTGTGWVTDLFSTGLLLSRRAKDASTERLDKSWLYIVLPGGPK